MVRPPETQRRNTVKQPFQPFGFIPYGRKIRDQSQNKKSNRDRQISRYGKNIPEQGRFKVYPQSALVGVRAGASKQTRRDRDE